jgi:hypothetical protein
MAKAEKNISVRKSGYDTGTASEFLVLSNLYRMGINAFISLGNKKSIDIIIKAKSGSSVSVDVKSVQGYSSIVVNNVKAAANHFIVVVVYKNKFADPTVLPDFYIIPSDRVLALSEDYNGQRRLLKSKIVDYQDKWEPLKA